MHKVEGFSAKNLESSLFNCQNAIRSWSGWPVLKKEKSLPRWRKVQSEKKKRRSMRFLAYCIPRFHFLVPLCTSRRSPLSEPLEDSG